MLRGFAADSSVICSDAELPQPLPLPAGPHQLRLPEGRPGGRGRDAAAAQDAAPPDVEPYSREQILAREIDHWVNQTSTGQLFAFGVLVAMIVAAVVVYQVLSNDVREHLPEYATLKAMGYSFRRLAVVVVAQSMIYMLISYVIAVILGLDRLSRDRGTGGHPHADDHPEPADSRSPWRSSSASCRASCRSPGCGRPSRRSSSERAGRGDTSYGRNPCMLPRKIIPLAWRNLTENRRRLLTSVAGTAFAVTLMFMENGFRHAMLDSMVNVIERLDGQVVDRQPDPLYACRYPMIPLPPDHPPRATRRSIDSSPVYVITRFGFWRNILGGSLERICVIGVPLEKDVLNVDEVKEYREALPGPTRSWPTSSRGRRASETSRAGQVSELSGRRVRVVGTFKLGINAQSNGNLIMSDRNLLRLFPEHAGAHAGGECRDHRRAPHPPGRRSDRVRPSSRRRCPPTSACSRSTSSSPGSAILGQGGADRYRLLYRGGDGLHRGLRDLLPGALRRHQRPARRVRHAQGDGLLEPQALPRGRDAGRLSRDTGVPRRAGREPAPVQLGPRGDRPAAGPVPERSRCGSWPVGRDVRASGAYAARKLLSVDPAELFA